MPRTSLRTMRSFQPRSIVVFGLTVNEVGANDGISFAGSASSSRSVGEAPRCSCDPGSGRMRIRPRSTTAKWPARSCRDETMAARGTPPEPPESSHVSAAAPPRAAYRTIQRRDAAATATLIPSLGTRQPPLFHPKNLTRQSLGTTLFSCTMNEMRVRRQRLGRGPVSTMLP